MAIEDILHPLLGNYWEAPRWLKASLGRAYALVPERLRLGASYYRFREELAADGAAALAERKLAETLRWALRSVPAYKPWRSLLDTVHDARDLLARLPVTSKLDIKRRPDAYVSKAMPASSRLRMVTGGTTQPLEFHLEKHVTRSKEYAFIRDFQRRVGMGPGDLTLSLRGRPVPGGALWAYEPIRRQLVFSSAHLEERHMPGLAEALAQHRPAFIEAFPSLLYPLARWIAANGAGEWDSSLRGVLLYSEAVYGFQARLFSEVFRCPVLRHYGHSERVLMAASMPDDERYFFWPGYGWLELLDADDRPITQPGVLGHVVGTSFDNRVMPFVRYRTGDLAVLGAEGHPALPGFAACERIEGRVQEFLIDREGRAVSLRRIGAGHAPAFARVDAMQYRQDRPGKVVLSYVSAAPLDAADLEHMAQVIADKAACDVELVRVERIERTARGKQPLLVQKLDVRAKELSQ